MRAVGETGLDFFRTGPEGLAAQEESFRRHVDIAVAASTGPLSQPGWASGLESA